jgi:lipid-A-disaccharide synthase
VNPKRIMLIAGEASGDTLAAELVRALKAEAARNSLDTDLQFFGAGGPKMAEGGRGIGV